MMRVYLASDHAGFDLKAELFAALEAENYDLVDCGAHELDPDDDYPEFCIRAAEAVVSDPGSLGVVIGGSGNGEQIAANKVRGIRAALAWSPETAQLARAHNDANVVGIGARMHPAATALAIVRAFLTTPFSQAPRHERRIAEIDAYELKKSLDSTQAGPQ